MDARAAAEAIRNHIDLDHSQTRSAEERHRHDFVVEVCRQLGIETMLFNMEHIADVLDQRGIRPEIAQYPKMLTNDGRPVLYPDGHPQVGQPIVFESEDEEAAYTKAKEPAPEPPPHKTGAHTRSARKGE